MLLDIESATYRGIRRYNEILLVVDQFMNLLSDVNPAVGMIAEDYINFYIEYLIYHYDDYENSNYQFMCKQFSIIEKRIQNGKIDDINVIKKYQRAKERFDKYPPLFIKDKKTEHGKMIAVTFTSRQIGRSYVARNQRMCNIMMPYNCFYQGYAIPVPESMIKDGKSPNIKYFESREDYIHTLSYYEKSLGQWLKIQLTTAEIKEQMDHVFEKRKNDVSQYQNSNNIQKKEGIKQWTTITFTEKQMGKTYVANGIELCRIRLPFGCEFENYGVTVQTRRIFNSKTSDTKYFKTPINAMHILSHYNTETKQWDKVSITTAELKKQMHQIFRKNQFKQNDPVSIDNQNRNDQVDYSSKNNEEDDYNDLIESSGKSR